MEISISNFYAEKKQLLIVRLQLLSQRSLTRGTETERGTERQGQKGRDRKRGTEKEDIK